MKYFEHYRAESFEDAAEELKRVPDAEVLAGGTDLLSSIKNDLLETTPSQVVSIQSIPGSAGITVKDGKLFIGANTTLTAIEESKEVKKHLPVLAEAAHSVATPLIRNMGTLGGNICQDIRCWFYRYPHEAGGRLDCRRKGGDTCYAILGDNRYHSVYGGMRCGSNPCTTDCPAATAIPEYMAQLRKDNVDGAAQIILDVNPMPAITSRVCAHFCQDNCNKNDTGEPVAIRNVERFVGDYALKNARRFYAKPGFEAAKKVAVVGSGPAGLTAAYYLRQAGCEVVVYDSKEEPGGMLLYAIPDYRLPKSIVRKYTKALEAMGIRFITSTQVGKDIKIDKLEKDYDAVYLATGTWKRPVLGISGENLTVFGLDFLVQVHEWMDGKVGKEVLVTGGGNVAMDVAITAKRLGAKKVTLACLEQECDMPAGKEEVNRAREEGIEIMAGWGLSKVMSKKGKVQGMELKRCTSCFDKRHRFAPVYDEKDTLVVEAENILMAVGQSVDISFLDKKHQVELTKQGLIDVEDTSQMTSREGVFAGGDVTTGPSTVIQCITNGHAAARGILRYLKVEIPHSCKGMQTSEEFLTFDTAGVEVKEALKLKEQPVAKRSLDKEDEIAPKAEAALEEAKRCMNCGCYAVEPSDVTPVLVALDALIITTEREIKARDFCCSELKVTDVLNKGELVTEVVVPIPKGAVGHYDKFRLREAVDWAIVSLASILSTDKGKVTGARLVLGGVAPVPIRLNKVEGYLLGKELNDQTIERAAQKAVVDCAPLWKNQYKVVEIKAYIEKALRRVAK